MKEPVRDNNSKIVGRFDGNLLRDGNGKIIARYDPLTNKTRDANGKLIGYGDQRMRLL